MTTQTFPKTVALGSINIPTAEILIGDPINIENHVDNCVTVNVPTGEFPVFTSYYNENNDYRVAELEIVFSSVENFHPEQLHTHFVGDFPVDGGQMIVTDTSNLRLWTDDVEDPFGFAPELVGEFNFMGASSTTLYTPEQAGILGDNLAATSSTGFGDGIYDVYLTFATDEAGVETPVSLTCLFLLNEE